MKIKQQVQELFPTPLWILDIAPADAAPFNARLKAEIETIISPRAQAAERQELADAARPAYAPGLCRTRQSD
jgi:hypothetical protein